MSLGGMEIVLAEGAKEVVKEVVKEGVKEVANEVVKEVGTEVAFPEIQKITDSFLEILDKFEDLGGKILDGEDVFDSLNSFIDELSEVIKDLSDSIDGDALNNEGVQIEKIIEGKIGQANELLNKIAEFKDQLDTLLDTSGMSEIDDEEIDFEEGE